MPRPALCCLAVLLVCLSGCGQRGGFPSLAPRPIEQVDASVSAPTAPTASGVADAAILARLTPILAAAEAGHGRFETELAAARPIIEQAAGSAQSGEAWVAGQEALSRVSAARGALVAALADLDALRREQIDSPNPANRAALDEAGRRLAALDAEESARLAELAGKLG